MFDSLKSQKPQSKVMTSPCNPKPCALGAVRKTEDMRVQKEVEKTPLEMIPTETASRIVVMGATGSGKSTFINLVSESTLSVSNGLRSCTSVVQESKPFTLDDQNVILVDTPGFDDTTRPDTDIITAISTYLVNMYKQGVRLSGVIYMHRISDVRIGGTSLLNFRIFRALCGDENLHSAVIVTTMWSGVELMLGESREHELATAEDLFKPVLDNGAQLVRHDGTLESARAILHSLVTNNGATLRIQHELVDEGKELINTAAGAELVRLFAEQARRLEARSKKVHRQIEEASIAQDEEGWTMLQLELDEIQKEERRVEEENKRLRGMAPSAINTDPLWRSTEFVGRLGGTYLRGPQGGFPMMSQPRMLYQERPNEVQKAKKRTKIENERLQEEVYAVSTLIERLKSRSAALHNDLRAASRAHSLGTGDGTELAERVDRTLEEMEVLQQQIDLAVENQDKLVAEVRKHQEESGKTSMCGRVIAWFLSGM